MTMFYGNNVCALHQAGVPGAFCFADDQYADLNSDQYKFRVGNDTDMICWDDTEDISFLTGMFSVSSTLLLPEFEVYSNGDEDEWHGPYQPLGGRQLYWEGGDPPTPEIGNRFNCKEHHYPYTTGGEQYNRELST